MILQFLNLFQVATISKFSSAKILKRKIYFIVLRFCYDLLSKFSLTNLAVVQFPFILPKSKN